MGDRTVGIDVVGAAIVAASSALLVLPLNFGASEDWPLWTWLSLAAAAAGFGLFAWQQRSTAARGRTPLVTPSLFTRPAYTVGLAGIGLFFCASIGTQLVLTLFLQVGNGFSAGEAGLGNLPVAIGTAVGGALSGAFLAEKLGRKVLMLGAVLQIAGTALLWSELQADGAFSIWTIVPGIALAGVGSGAIIAALFSVILAAVKDDEIGSASGLLTAVQSIAGSVGVAVFGSIFFSALKTGSPSDAYIQVLGVQAVLVVLFFALAFLFPKKARPESESQGIAEADAEISALG